MALTAGPLFGTPETRSQSRNLVEFRAGKMFMSRGNMVHADARKGLVYVYQSPDGLMHFCWKDRATGSIEDDLIIFPEDAEYKHVPQCNTGRVYVLKFKNSSRRQFFWLQEPKTDKDEEFCKQVNDCLNNPPSARSARNRMRHAAEAPVGGGATTGGTATGGAGTGAAGGGSRGGVLGEGAGSEDNLHSLLNNLNQEQLMELFGGIGGIGGLGQLLSMQRGNQAPALQQVTSGGSRTSGAAARTAAAPSAGGATAAAPATAAAGGPTVASSGRDTNNNPPGGGTPGAAKAAPIQLTDLQNILRGIKAPGDDAAAAGGAGTGASSAPKVDLSLAMSSDSLRAILDNPEFMAELSKLVPEMKGKSASDEVTDTVNSPQFHQAVSVFSTALQSGQLGPVIAQFDLGADAIAAATAGDMEGFIKALDAGKGKEKEKKEGEQKKNTQDKRREGAGQDDDDMAVD